MMVSVLLADKVTKLGLTGFDDPRLYLETEKQVQAIAELFGYTPAQVYSEFERMNDTE
jgi:hypothetical protein